MIGSLFLEVGILARAMSCQSREDLEEKEVPRVSIIGNSITYHPPDVFIGWNANWEVTASRPEKTSIPLKGAMIILALALMHIQRFPSGFFNR